MSNYNQPPVSPPPGSPPPGGLPPNGPTEGGPEYLSHGGGEPVPPARSERSSRKPLIIGVAAVAGIGLVGGAAFAVTSLLATGDQPAQALPASTLGYMSIDLDPSGGQKIEALRTLNKFPAFSDEVNVDSDADLGQVLFDKIQEESACANLDYAADIEPWLGDRAALAAVDLGEERPTVAFVIQVSDAGAAEAGLDKIANCSGSGDAEDDGSRDPEVGGFAVSGDWAVVSETDALAEKISDAAAEGSLADDSDYSTWSARAGDPGFISMYASPAAGEAMLEQSGDLSDLDPMVAPEIRDQFADFGGAAATVRFSDGGVELEVAADAGKQAGALKVSDRGGEVISALPADTVAAFGVGFEEGWVTDLADQFSGLLGEDMTADDLFAEVSAQTGLDLPGDAETLFGESTAIAIGADFDPESAINSGDGSDVPIAMLVKGDPTAMGEVLGKITAQLPPEAGPILGSDSDGDLMAIGPNEDYRQKLLEGGDLGDSEPFTDVIAEADTASGIFYLNFGGSDGWLVDLAQDTDPEVAANLEPLSALGMSSWMDDDVSHAVIRLTTE